MTKAKLAIGLLVGGLATTASFKASAVPCGYTTTGTDIDHTYMHHAFNWKKQNPSTGDVSVSAVGSIFNSSTTTTAAMIMPVFASYPPSGNAGMLLFSGTPLNRLRVLVMLNDDASPSATCTLRAYSPLTHAFTVSYSQTTSCGMDLSVQTQGNDVLAHVRCDLPPRVTGLPSSEILNTGEYLAYQ